MAEADKETDTGGHATEGMGGKGYYDDHSKAQKEGIAFQETRLCRVADHVSVAGPELRIMDYGCGPGRNSMAAFRAVLDAVRRRSAALPVVAAHNDQIGNDWNDLVANLRGPDSYLRDPGSIRAEIAIGSFFGQVASAASVDIGMCFGAAHWLSRPVLLPSSGSLFFCDLPEPARDAVAVLADNDWTEFLRQRARELRPGGWFVVDMLASTPDPQDPSGVRAAGRNLYRALWRIAEEMAGEGRIDPNLLERFVFPVYFRLSDEARKPLDREPDLRDGLELFELANDLLPMPTELGDAAAYAGFARAFAESTLRTQLFEGSAPDPATADALADDFFERLRDLFAAEPGRHAFEHQLMTLVLRRKND